MILIDNEVIGFLSVNAYFCYSPVGLDRKYCKMRKKQALLNVWEIIYVSHDLTLVKSTKW